MLILFHKTLFDVIVTLYRAQFEANYITLFTRYYIELIRLRNIFNYFQLPAVYYNCFSFYKDLSCVVKIMCGSKINNLLVFKKTCRILKVLYIILKLMMLRIKLYYILQLSKNVILYSIKFNRNTHFMSLYCIIIVIPYLILKAKSLKLIMLIFKFYYISRLTQIMMLFSILFSSNIHFMSLYAFIVCVHYRIDCYGTIIMCLSGNLIFYNKIQLYRLLLL